MTDEPKHRFPFRLAVLCTIVGLAAAYFSAYYLMVSSGLRTISTTIGMQQQQLPHYRYGGTIAEWIFTPAHRLDIVLRPKTWRIEIQFQRNVDNVYQQEREKHGK